MKKAERRGSGPRVTLVSLPFQYFPGSLTRHFNYVRPPLGVAALAAYLRADDELRAEVRCLDLMTIHTTAAAVVADHILATDPDVVGLTVLTATAPLAQRVTTELKRRRPGIRVVAGGPHITSCPAEVFPGLDAKVLGEGETSLTALVREFWHGLAEADIQGVWRVKADGTSVPGSPAVPLPDLDALPFAAVDLLPLDCYYHGFPYRGVRRFMTLMTSRGCPYNCNFCGNRAIWGKKVRHMSAERVLAEIDWLVKELGVDLIFFEDDTFTAHRARTQAILRGIRTRHPGLRWICHSRVDCLDDEIVDELAASGCVEVQVGVESGDDRVLASTGKGINLAQAHRTVSRLKQRGINVWATFILGHEEETHESLTRTLRTAIEMNPTYASFILLLPFPGTAVFERFERQGYLKTRDWERYSWHGEPVFETGRLRADELVAFRSYANRRFFLRPTKMAELFAKTMQAGSFREMARNVVSWMTIVGRRR